VYSAKREDLTIETMPSRKKPSEREAKESISRSLQLLGLDLIRSDRAAVHRKISSQVLVDLSFKTHGPTIVDAETDSIPKDRNDAIEFVFVAELCDYLDERSYIVNASEAPVKGSFQRRDAHKLNRVKLSPEQLAFNDFYHDESSGRLLGNAFEAIVASYAVHNIQCPCCHGISTAQESDIVDGSGASIRRSTGAQTVDSLRWTGGSETSWRDLYCISCQSCFEIKSKESKANIVKAFKHDSLPAGSFRTWCKEDFTGRIQGRDYIVIVNRTLTEQGWTVYIAEIGTVLPVAISDANQDRIYVQTNVTLRNPRRWFCIPGGDRTDLKEIFRIAYERVFPGRWSSVGGPPPVAHATNESRPCDGPTSVDDLVAELRKISVENWDDSD
jgi:hypothetical protein